MTCDDCVFANWARTANGRLHPSKQGRCTRLDRFPVDLRLPAAFRWSGFGPPNPNGGYIWRGELHKNYCAFKEDVTP
jgi:hypothetical protein